jgi:hypothetical protein
MAFQLRDHLTCGFGISALSRILFMPRRHLFRRTGQRRKNGTQRHGLRVDIPYAFNDPIPALSRSSENRLSTNISTLPNVRTFSHSFGAWPGGEASRSSVT